MKLVKMNNCLQKLEYYTYFMEWDKNVLSTYRGDFDKSNRVVDKCQAVK